MRIGHNLKACAGGREDAEGKGLPVELELQRRGGCCRQWSWSWEEVQAAFSDMVQSFLKEKKMFTIKKFMLFEMKN